MDKPFQRKGSSSNAAVGKDFERKAQAFFATQGMNLHSKVSMPIGINGTKIHSFDLGSPERKILVECKSLKWREGGGVPSAKITIWNEAMYFFYAAPTGYRKILFVLRDYSQKKQETLAEYCIRTYIHLIPKDVEIWEFDESQKKAVRMK